MNLTCPCCGRVPLDGLSEAEAKMVAKLAASDAPLSAAELLGGLRHSPSAFSQMLIRLKAKIERQGYQIVNTATKPGMPGKYKLAKAR